MTLKLLYATRPIYDKQKPDAPPEQFVEWQWDDGPIHTGLIVSRTLLTDEQLLDAIVAGEIGQTLTWEKPGDKVEGYPVCREINK